MIHNMRNIDGLFLKNIFNEINVVCFRYCLELISEADNSGKTFEISSTPVFTSRIFYIFHFVNITIQMLYITF